MKGSETHGANTWHDVRGCCSWICMCRWMWEPRVGHPWCGRVNWAPWFKWRFVCAGFGPPDVHFSVLVSTVSVPMCLFVSGIWSPCELFKNWCCNIFDSEVSWFSLHNFCCTSTASFSQCCQLWWKPKHCQCSLAAWCHFPFPFGLQSNAHKQNPNSKFICWWWTFSLIPAMKSHWPTEHCKQNFTQVFHNKNPNLFDCADKCAIQFPFHNLQFWQWICWQTILCHWH